MYGMLTGTISSGILLLREIDPNFNTPAANNLIIGSGFGIVFGIPVLVLVGLAPKSDLTFFLTMAIAALYFLLLLLLIYKARSRKAKKAKAAE
jgi:ESS family glutamate:Na+ symporter